LRIHSYLYIVLVIGSLAILTLSICMAVVYGSEEDAPTISIYITCDPSARINIEKHKKVAPHLVDTLGRSVCVDYNNGITIKPSELVCFSWDEGNAVDYQKESKDEVYQFGSGDYSVDHMHGPELRLQVNENLHAKVYSLMSENLGATIMLVFEDEVIETISLPLTNELVPVGGKIRTISCDDCVAGHELRDLVRKEFSVVPQCKWGFELE